MVFSSVLLTLGVSLGQNLRIEDAGGENLSFGEAISAWKLRNLGQISRRAARLPGGAMISCDAF